jgi:hypothetical protein
MRHSLQSPFVANRILPGLTYTSAMANPAATSRVLRPKFYLGMTLLMAFFVFGGFGMSYWYPMVNGRFPPAPAVVHYR